jgi:hypothetical protein
MISNSQIIFHGSVDSLDCDAFVIVDKIPQRHEADETRKLLRQERNIDANFITIKDGLVSESYLGLKDEANNGICLTFDDFKQYIKNPIKHLVQRDVAIKWLRVIRGILTFCSRTQHRDIVKSALRGHLNEKLKALHIIAKDLPTSFQKSTKEDVYKFIAFQSIQYLGLLEDIEIFSKQKAIEFYCDSLPFINRNPGGNLNVISTLIDSVANIYPNQSNGYLISDDGNFILSDFGKLEIKTEKYVGVDDSLK